MNATAPEKSEPTGRRHEPSADLIAALKAVQTIELDRHDTNHMWPLPSGAARKYWAPVLGPTATLFVDLAAAECRDQPVTLTAADLRNRLGVNKVHPFAAALRRAIVGVGAQTEFNDDGSHLRLSLPTGVCPPAQRVRNRHYSPELEADFQRHLVTVKATVREHEPPQLNPPTIA